MKKNATPTIGESARPYEMPYATYLTMRAIALTHATKLRITHGTPSRYVCKTKKKSQAEGRWRGGTRQVQPGDTIKVDRNKEDIEGIVHKDGSVTKLKGALCDGWSEEHDADWLRNNWGDCAPARGGSVSPRMFFAGFAESSVYTFARVDAAIPNWQDGRPLAANHNYRVIPRSSDRWTFDRGRTFVDFHGSGGRMNGSEIGIPKDNLPIGGLVCLVWHHQADGSAWPQIIDFPAGSHAAEFSIGAHGGSIHFVIADRANTYADNFGDCVVALTTI